MPKRNIEEFEQNIGEVATIREIIRNNLLATIVSFIFTFILVSLIDFDLINSLWEISYDVDYNYYLSRTSGELGMLISGIIGIFVQNMVITLIRVVRFIILCILTIIIINTLMYYVINILLQTKIRIKYLLLINIISVVITLTISYFTIPDVLEIMFNISYIFESLFGGENIFESITNFENYRSVFIFFKSFYLPILINIFVNFLISSIVQISIRKIAFKKSEVIITHKGRRHDK
jgi:hypothetical protein